MMSGRLPARFLPGKSGLPGKSEPIALGTFANIHRLGGSRITDHGSPRRPSRGQKSTTYFARSPTFVRVSGHFSATYPQGPRPLSGLADKSRPPCKQGVGLLSALRPRRARRGELTNQGDTVEAAKPTSILTARERRGMMTLDGPRQRPKRRLTGRGRHGRGHHGRGHHGRGHHGRGHAGRRHSGRGAALRGPAHAQGVSGHGGRGAARGVR